MQTKDRERVNKKTGKVTVVRDSTPIKKGVVVVKEDTAMKQLQRFCDVCKVRDRKSTRLNSSHIEESRMPSSA